MTATLGMSARRCTDVVAWANELGEQFAPDAARHEETLLHAGRMRLGVAGGPDAAMPAR